MAASLLVVIHIIQIKAVIVRGHTNKHVFRTNTFCYDT